MKKNLLSIIILALLIVNLIFTAIMMFGVTSASKKTSQLVGDIVSVLQLEMSANESEEAETVSIEDTELYDIADSFTIPLVSSVDGSDHYYVVQVSLSMNKKNKDFATFSEEMASKESLIRSVIIEVISGYTFEDAKADPVAMRQEILSRLQAMYESDFIFDVTFRDVMFQ